MSELTESWTTGRAEQPKRKHSEAQMRQRALSPCPLWTHPHHPSIHGPTEDPWPNHSGFRRVRLVSDSAVLVSDSVVLVSQSWCGFRLSRFGFRISRFGFRFSRLVTDSAVLVTHLSVDPKNYTNSTRSPNVSLEAPLVSNP